MASPTAPIHGGAGWRRGAHPLRVRRRPPSVRRGRQRLCRRVQRHRGRRTTPLAAGGRGRRVPSPGLRRRLDELVGGRAELEAPLDAALAGRTRAAGARLVDAPVRSTARTRRVWRRGRPMHRRCCWDMVRQQVLARTPGARTGSFEGRRVLLDCDLHPLADGLRTRRRSRLERALGRIAEPLRSLWSAA